MDLRNHIAELGYNLAPAHWGKGLATEAARAVIDWRFDAYDLAKVFAGADVRNQRSWKVMEKLGMKREGLMRSHRRVRGDQRIDQVWYGLLREEWEAKR